MLEQLKRFNADVTTIEETVALAAYGKLVRAEFEARSIPTPEWLDDANRRISRAIESQTRDQKELRLKQIAAEKSKLLTPTERKAALEAEEAALLASVK